MLQATVKHRIVNIQYAYPMDEPPNQVGQPHAPKGWRLPSIDTDRNRRIRSIIAAIAIVFVTMTQGIVHAQQIYVIDNEVVIITNDGNILFNGDGITVTPSGTIKMTATGDASGLNAGTVTSPIAATTLINQGLIDVTSTGINSKVFGLAAFGNRHHLIKTSA